jgi:hypothetical protein
MENTKNSKVTLAIIAGLAVGAATWYFMNTKNGKQHWETFLDVANDMTDKFKKASLESSKSISNHVSNVSSILKDGIKLS